MGSEPTITPKWLDRNFLQTALREGLRRGSLDINTYSIKLATKPGDNYLSQMFRGTANVVSRRKSAEELGFVVKILPRGESAVKYCEETQMFAREIQMLSDTLPVLNKILEEINEPKLSAELLYLQTEPEEILILEDLCLSGFKSVNRLEYLDLQHSKLVVEHLALFHAASLTAFPKDPKLSRAYFDTFWSDNEFTVRFLNDGLASMRECLRQWKILPEVLDKFEKLDDQVAFKKLLKSTSRKENDLFVLNHGDPWTSNLMFKYTNDQPTDLRFVDFQLSCVNSPTIDLLYFITTSLKLDIRTENVVEILEAYYKKLSQTCIKLNINLNLSFDDLKKDYYDRLFFGFFLLIVLVPHMSVPSEEAKDLNQILDRETISLDEYSNDYFKKTAMKLLPYFMEHGIFDCN